jgi:hypothetical protein
MGTFISQLAATMFIAALLGSIVSAVWVQLSGTRVTAEGFGNLLLGWLAAAGLFIVVYTLMELYARTGGQRYLDEIDEIRRSRQATTQEGEDRHDS